MSLSPGTKLAHYELLELIGQGGMGEVYRARDGKLGREVAIKVLPEAFAENEERLARFKRDAKVLASLNHPNIASIYGLEQSDNTHYLVLELVPGETLAERIARGPIPLEEALDIAAKMAEALEEAHEQAIVHRDLKPANVKQTEDGKIKVLDFGLAKVFQEETPDADSSMSPTLTRDATRVGVILGTAAYMSPEQAKGKRVDKRADVWACGAVLYEMLTGKRAFASEDVSDTLAYVLTKDPDWEALPAKTPTWRPATWAAMGVALMVGSVVTGIVDWSLRPDAPRPLARFVVSAPSESPSFGPTDVDVAITTDGTRIVYRRDDGRLLVRALDDLGATPLVGLAGTTRGPFLSPDGNWVGSFAGNLLKKVSILGGPSVTLCALPGGRPRGASWGTDGAIVFATWTLAGSSGGG